MTLGRLLSCIGVKMSSFFLHSLEIYHKKRREDKVWKLRFLFKISMIILIFLEIPQSSLSSIMALGNTE